MAGQKRDRFLRLVVICLLSVAIGSLSLALSSDQVASALGMGGTASETLRRAGTTPAALTTWSNFLPLILKDSGLTTYAGFLPQAPAAIQMVGTGSLIGFGLILGLVLLSEKPFWFSWHQKEK